MIYDPNSKLQVIGLTGLFFADQDSYFQPLRYGGVTLIRLKQNITPLQVVPLLIPKIIIGQKARQDGY
jgi:hypothetical protein